MAKRVPKAFLDTVRAHRNKLEKTLQGNAASKMKSLYEEANGSLVMKLAKTIKTGRGDSFSAYQMRVAQAQLREGQALISQRLAGSMTPLTKNAQEQALKGLVNDVRKLHKKFTGGEIVLPVEEASVFAGVVQRRASTLLRANQTSFSRYGVNVVEKVEKQMAVSMLKGETPSDVVDTIAETIGGEWWQGDRIVRTEMAYAYNSTHRDGIAESAEDMPGLMMRWEEHCDDGGSPLDDRVGVDSIAMHGQVAKPGDLFIMPATAPFPDEKGRTAVPEALVGRSWSFPPNRPHDRAVISPWMADWGVPGWIYEGGRRKWLNT
jgi:hypothetical protein